MNGTTTLECGCVVRKNGGHTHTDMCTPCRTALFNQTAREDYARREARLKPPVVEDFSDII